MRLIGLDIGEKRVGLAVSDPHGRVATPLRVLAAPLSVNLAAFVRIIEDYEAAAVVVGLPLGMNGEEGPQAISVREEADRLARSLSIPLVYHDERLSSAEARRTMTAAGVSDKKKRGSVDMVAAAIVLQSYLDSGGPERDGIQDV